MTGPEPPPQPRDDAALAAACRRLQAACERARTVLLGSEPGRLPRRWECPPDHVWLLDDIVWAEMEVDRLRAQWAGLSPAQAAQWSLTGALHTNRQGRDAARMFDWPGRQPA